MTIKDAGSLTPFESGVEYSAPARGPWNIVHVGDRKSTRLNSSH